MKKWNRTFLQWLLSYAMIYALILAMGVLIFLFAIHTMNEETDRMQSQAVAQVGAELEREVEQIRQILYNMIKSTDMRYLMAEEREHYQYREHMRQQAIQEQMLQYKVSNQMLDSLYVYCPVSGYLLSDSGVVVDRWFVEMSAEESKQRAVLDAIEEKEDGSVQISRSRGEWLVSLQISSYKKQGREGQRKNGTVLALFSYSKLLEVLQNESSQYYLLTEDGQALSDEGVAAPPESVRRLWEEKREQAPGRKVELERTKRAVYAWRVLGESGLMLICETDTAVYLHKIYQMLWLVVLYVVAGLGLSFYISYTAVSKRYQKLKEMLRLTKGEQEAEQDDFIKLELAMRRILKQSENQKQSLVEQEIAIRNLIMSKILSGRTGYLNERERQFFYEKEALSGDTLFVAAIYMEEDRIFGEETDKTEGNILELLYFSVENVAGELFGEQFPCMAAEVKGVVYLLASVGDDYSQERFEAETKALSWKMADFLRTSCQIETYILISRLHHGWEEAELCYQEITELREYRDIHSREDAVLHYTDLLAEEEQAPGMQLEEKQQEQRQAIQQEQEETEKEKDRQVEKRQEEKRQERKSNEAEHLIDEIVLQIQQDYKNPNLTVSLLAEGCGMSASNLSQVFKRRMKIGPYEYISRLRFEAAKELILSGMAIKEVAEEVGYYNTKPLSRMFRETYGTSPAKWRDNMLKQM